MKKTILITGGAGFIGSNLVRYLYEKYPDYKIIVLDCLTYAGNIENFPVNINTKNENDRFVFWYGNVRNGNLVDTLIAQSDVVIHMAAETHVSRSIYDNYSFYATDVIGTQIVANAVVKHKNTIERFIHVSTSEVYGSALSDTMDEKHPLMPSSPYASAKTGADRLVYSYWYTYDIPAIIVRPFNNYGFYQHLEKAIPRFITSCLINEPIRIHGDGNVSRDYIFISDTCKAFDLLIHCDLNTIKGEVFNVSSGVHRSILSIAKEIIKMMCKDESLITFTSDRPGQVTRHTGNSRKIQELLDWQPEITWENGLKQTIAWYKENKKWWEKQLWMRTVPIITKNGNRALH